MTFISSLESEPYKLKTKQNGISGWLNGLAPAFSPGLDPGVMGSSPTSGSLWSLLLLLSLCVSLMDKINFKKILKKNL